MSAEQAAVEPTASLDLPLTGRRIGMVIDQAGHRDERAVRQLEHLALSGARVRVWAVRADHWEAEPDVFEQGGVEYRRRSLGPKGESLHARSSTTAAVADFLEGWASEEITSWQPDLVAHHADVTLPLGVRLAESLDVPLVSDFPDLPAERRRRQNHPYRRWQPVRYRPKPEADRALREFYPRTTGRLTASPGLASALKRRYGGAEPGVLFNVPNWDPSLQSARIAPDVRSMLGLDEDVPLVVFVGNVKRGLNLEAIFEALHLLPEWQLALVGSAAWQIEKFDLDSNVRATVLGRVHVIARQPDNQLPDFLRTADVGVFVPVATHFNLYHCAPNKFFAMALAGIPLVVSDLPFMAQTVRRLQIGQVIRRANPNDLAEALKVARSQRQKVADRRQLVVSAYGWHNQRASLSAVYSAALLS